MKNTVLSTFALAGIALLVGGLTGSPGPEQRGGRGGGLSGNGLSNASQPLTSFTQTGTRATVPDREVRNILVAQISRDGSKVTGPVTLITQSAGVWDLKPAWSPDGQAIAFWRAQPDAPAVDWALDLVVRSLTGKETTYSFGKPSFFGRPTWFPDRQSILIKTNGSGQATRGIRRLDLKSGDSEQLHVPTGGDHSDWRAILPDGRILQESIDLNRLTPVDHIVIWDLAGREEKDLFVVPDGVIAEMALSPDGKQIALVTVAFSCDKVKIGACDYRVSRVGVDGKGFQELCKGVGSAGRLLAWSADSSAILFGQSSPNAATDAQIMWIPTAGGSKPAFTGLTLKNISFNQNDTISVSPDGRIVFSGSPGSVSIAE